jgi:hypothetical protein
MRLILGILVLGLPLMAVAQESTEDVVPGVPFQEGEVLSYEQLDKLKDYLPPEFWENREYFFYEGMEIEIGPFFRKYGAADAYVKASIENKGKARLGKDGSITGDVAGIPFWPDDTIPTPGSRSSGTSSRPGTGTGTSRPGPTPTGTGASSCPSTTRGPPRGSGSSTGSSSSTSRTTATSSRTRSADPPSGSRSRRRSTRAASC